MGRSELIVDAQGRTEEEFLASYSPKDYPRPSLTADICVFKTEQNGLSILLIRRGGHPFLGCWATPGGFVGPHETAQAAAARELAEETGLRKLKLEEIGLFTTPGRDPRGWTISNAFVALDESLATPEASDDAADAAWFHVSSQHKDDRIILELSHESERLTISFKTYRSPLCARERACDVEGVGLAFDHADIIAHAWLSLPHSLREH